MLNSLRVIPFQVDSCIIDDHSSLCSRPRLQKPSFQQKLSAVMMQEQVSPSKMEIDQREMSFDLAQSHSSTSKSDLELGSNAGKTLRNCFDDTEIKDQSLNEPRELKSSNESKARSPKQLDIASISVRKFNLDGCEDHQPEKSTWEDCPPRRLGFSLTRPLKKVCLPIFPLDILESLSALEISS
jgi:hypothetical protein